MTQIVSGLTSIFFFGSLQLSVAGDIDSLATKKNTADQVARNTIFVEGGGNAITHSLNFDRILLRHDKYKLALRLGASYRKDDDYPASDIYVFVTELNFIEGSRNHFEYGGGFTLIFENSFKALYFTARPLGYRLQKKNGGLFIKFGILLFVKVKEQLDRFEHKNDEPWIIPWAGLGIGFTFKKKNL